MSTLPQQRPTQGVAPELSSRCAGCGAALAPDQLFCLSCGTRRRDARIAFRDVLASEAAPAQLPADGSGAGSPGVPAGMPVATAQGPGRQTSYTPFIATLASLLLALGLGVWIGRGQDAPAAVAAPIAAAPAAAAAPTTPLEAAPADDAAAADDDAAAKDDAEADDADADTGSTAPSPELKKLDSLAPEDYQKQSQKLPKEVGTGGAPPPKDNKPAGGGSEFETFE